MSATLYNDAIVALARSKAGTGRLEAPTGHAEADNPLCGDRVRLDVVAEGGCVAAVAHETRGCLLTEAAAACLAEALPGRSVEEAAGLHGAIEAWLKGATEAPPLDGLAVFEPVRAVRSRHDCVLIPFEALRSIAKP